MNWEKLIAELDERHNEDAYEFVVTAISFMVAVDDPESSYIGVGLYVSHSADHVCLRVGRDDDITWFGKELILRPKITRRADIVNMKDLVLDAVDLINRYGGRED